MRLFLAFLLAWGSSVLAAEEVVAEPGSLLTLAFPSDDPSATWSVDPPLLPLHLSDPKAPPPLFAVVEVPKTTPPGRYRIRLGGQAKTLLVPGREALEVRLPTRAQNRLFLEALNQGNLPLEVLLRPAEESEVLFAPVRLSLAPGERRRLDLFLRGSGLLVLEAGGRRYSVRVGPEGKTSLLGEALLFTQGAGLTLRAKGRDLGFSAGLSLGEGGPQARLGLRGAAGFLELGPEGALAGWREGGTEVALQASGDGAGLRLSLLEGPIGLDGQLSLLPAPRLEGLRAGWTQGGLSLALGYPLFAEARAYLEGVEVYARAGEEAGLLRIGGPPYRLEGGVANGRPFAYAEYARELGEGAAFRIGLGHRDGVYGEGAFGYRQKGWGLLLEGRLGAGGPALSASLEGEWEGLRGRAFLSLLDGGQGEVEVRALPGAVLEDLGFFAKVSRKLLGPGGPNTKEAVRLEAGAVFRFSLELPEEVERLLSPSLALLQGETLPGAEVRLVALAQGGGSGTYRAVADGKGRFALRLPPGTYRASVLPPPGAVALPAQAEVELPQKEPIRLFPIPALEVRADCPPQAGRVRLLPAGEGLPQEVPCGGAVLLPEGRYRVVAVPSEGYRLRGDLPEVMEVFASRSTEVSPSQGPGTPVVLKPFEPIPLETIPTPPRPIPVRVFSLDREPVRVVAPREALWVEAPGAERVFWVGPGGRVEGKEKKDGLFLLLVPEGLPPGAYLVEAEGGQGKGSFEVVLDPGRPLFLVQFDPPRPAPNQKVGVHLVSRTLIQEAFLRLPWGETVQLEAASPPGVDQGEFFGSFLLPPLRPGQVVEVEGVAVSWNRERLSFRAAFRVR